MAADRIDRTDLRNHHFYRFASQVFAIRLAICFNLQQLATILSNVCYLFIINILIFIGHMPAQRRQGIRPDTRVSFHKF